MVSSASYLESPIIVLDYILKLRAELLKARKDNTMETFYWVRVVTKVDKFSNLANLPKYRENDKKRGGGSCSTSYSRAKQVDG